MYCKSNVTSCYILYCIVLYLVIVRVMYCIVYCIVLCIVINIVLYCSRGAPRREAACPGREAAKTATPMIIIILVNILLLLLLLPLLHTCHILPPSEIDLGLCLAVFAGSGGKYLFHRIGWRGRIWQLCTTTTTTTTAATTTTFGCLAACLGRQAAKATIQIATIILLIIQS